MREARLPRPVLSPSLREICTTSAGRAWLVLKRIRSREVAAVDRPMTRQQRRAAERKAAKLVAAAVRRDKVKLAAIRRRAARAERMTRGAN